MTLRAASIALAACLALAGCTTPLARLERTLAAQDSATAALGAWCKARRIADPPVIAAHQLRADSPPEPADLRAVLGVGTGEAVGYRHVALACGDTVLSVAHNWYVPARLTPAMNAALDTSDAPFGRVAAPLGFSRERLAAQRGTSAGCPQGTVLSHRARLVLPDGQPLSLVVECYTPANLRKR